MNNPGYTIVEVSSKKGGSCDVAIRCTHELETEHGRETCCREAIRRTAKAERGRKSQYVARIVRFEPDNPDPLPTGRRTFTGYVLQDRPLICVKVKPFEADSPEEAWVECVSRVKRSHRKGDVHEDRLYGSAENVDDKRDRHDVERKATLWEP